MAKQTRQMVATARLIKKTPRAARTKRAGFTTTMGTETPAGEPGGASAIDSRRALRIRASRVVSPARAAPPDRMASPSDPHVAKRKLEAVPSTPLPVSIAASTVNAPAASKCRCFSQLWRATSSASISLKNFSMRQSMRPSLPARLLPPTLFY